MGPVLNYSETPKTHDVQEARMIGTWLRELGSYLPNSVDFRNKSEEFRREFFAETVQALLEENFPKEIWKGNAARIFVRKNCEFFPSLKTLIDLLKEHSLPIRKAIRERERELQKSKRIEYYPSNLTEDDVMWLEHYREMEREGFVDLAQRRGTNTKQAKRSALSMLHNFAPDAYELVMKEEGEYD